jgi:hypothetical protein
MYQGLRQPRLKGQAVSGSSKVKTHIPAQHSVYNPTIATQYAQRLVFDCVGQLVMLGGTCATLHLQLSKPFKGHSESHCKTASLRQTPNGWKHDTTNGTYLHAHTVSPGFVEVPLQWWHQNRLQVTHVCTACCHPVVTCSTMTSWTSL